MHRIINKWIGVFVYPFFILFFSPVAQTQEADFDSIYKTTLDLAFKKSSLLLKQTQPNDIPFGELYIANLNDVLELIFSENEARYEQLKQNEANRIRLLKNAGDNSPYVGFIEGEIKLQWAFVKLKFGNTLSGVWSLRSAYKTVKDNIKAHPEFTLNYKTMGLLQVIFGAVPDNQRWILNILGLEGDVKNGLAQLKTLAEAPTPFAIEATLISSMIESYLLEEHEVALTTLKNNASTDKTMSEVYITALILMKAHKAQEAAIILREALDKPATNTPLLFEYLLAEALFQGGNYGQAKTHYLTYISQFQGRNQLKDSRMKVAMCEYFLGKNASFKRYWEEAIQTTGATSEADKNAEALLQAGSLPNFKLLQIRYAIDGGYYKLANRTISRLDLATLTSAETHEVTYRKARLFHLTNDYEQALALYEEVVSNTEQLPETYLAPNAYLQMGYIKMELNEKKAAELYFKKVLEFKKHPYKNSLDSKAKIALSTLYASGD
ncbi:tetratricopeptide repeat protein [Roseivirga echinicomitans]